MAMVKRRFFTAHWTSVISWVLMILATPVLGYLLYACCLKVYIRMVSIKNGRIKVGQDWVALSFFQCKVDVPLAHVESIRFDATLRNSKDEPPDSLYLYSRLDLKLKDGSVEGIMMSGFTKNQFKEIERAILEANPNIQVEIGAAEHLEKYYFLLPP